MPTQAIGRSFLVAALALILLAPALGAQEEAAEKPDRTFDAIAMSIGTAVQGSTRLVIRVDRWTTPEEADALQATIGPQRKQTELYDALQKQERTGSIQIPGELGHALRYAERSIENGREIIVLATDRPFEFQEVFEGGRSLEFNIGLIVLDLDPETGEGTGLFSVGTRFQWDEEKDRLVIVTAGSEPVRLTQVTETRKSLKKRGAGE